MGSTPTTHAERFGPTQAILSPLRPGAAPASLFGALALVGALSLILASCRASLADEAPGSFEDQHSLHYGVHLPRERSMARGFAVAEQLLADRRYAESLPVLISLLQTPEDAFDPESRAAPTELGAPPLESIKTRVRRLISDLPPEGRQAYLLEVKSRSERELRAALVTGPAALQTIIAKYPRTEAARLAGWVLAQQAFQEGRFEECEAQLASLLREGDLTGEQRQQIESQAALARIANNEPVDARSQRALSERLGAPVGDGDSASVASQIRASLLSNEADAGAWLTSGGGPRHNPVARVAPPRVWASWISPSASSAYWSAANAAAEAPPLPAGAANPLVVQNWVVVRERDALLGIDRDTGKQVWRRLLPASPRNAPGARRVLVEGELAYQRAVVEHEQRDAVASRISSNGRLVFAVADASAAATAISELERLRSQLYSGAPPAVNQIIAVDVVTEGKLLWRTSDQAELSGYFFLDCPLVVGERVYVIAERDQSVCLLQLDPGTGRLLWRQTLATVESPVQDEPMRQMVGAATCYADGTIVCSTGVGLVVAVDPMRRALKWVYRFPTEGGVQLGRGTSWSSSGVDRWPRDVADQWLWNQVLVHDGRVLVGSPESRQLHCLDLATGAGHWSTANARPQLLGAADGGLVIVARSDRVAALNLDHGTTAWTTALPEGASPSGVGVMFDKGYLLPLSNSEALLVEISSGKTLAELRVGPEGLMGNLAVVDNAVYSRSEQGVSRYEISTTPDPGATPRRRAELAAIQGDANQALAELIAGYRKSAEPQLYAALLRESLASDRLTGDLDWASLAEHERLYADRPTPLALSVARLRAAAEAGDGERVASEAVAFCERPPTGGLLAVSPSRAVRPARIVRQAVAEHVPPDSAARLREQLLPAAGPVARSVIEEVFGAPGVPSQPLAPLAAIPLRDDRWTMRQVTAEVLARAERARLRNGVRRGVDMAVIELPWLETPWPANAASAQLSISTDGQLTLLNNFGEVVLEAAPPNSVPDSLQRLASEGAAAAGRLGDLVFAGTGDDVVALSVSAPGREPLWSARASLLQQAEVQGSPRHTRLIEGRLRSSAAREARLVGVSPMGVTVASQDVLACLDPATGEVIWVVCGVDATGAPLADDRYVYSSSTIRPGWRADLATGEVAPIEPPSGERVAAIGARIALLRREAGGAELELLDRGTGQALLTRAYDRKAQHAAARDLVVVVDGSGVLEVINLLTGEVQLRDRLTLQGEPESVTAQRFGDRLLVGVNYTPAHVHRAAAVTPLDGAAVMTGPLYCYDLASGSPLWPAPVNVSGKALLARQPESCPVAVLAARVKERDTTGRFDSVKLLAIDIYSGRALYRDAAPRNDAGRQYRIQHARGPLPRVTIALDESCVTLTATADPAPPGPPASADVEQPQEGSLWDVGQSLGRFFEENLGAADGAPDQRAEDDD